MEAEFSPVELLKRARRGDVAALEAIVLRYHRAAYASAWSVLGNVADAEEIAQETFVHVFGKLDRLRDAEALGGWVWRISRDCALKRIRKNRRIKPVGDAPEEPDGSVAPVGRLIAAESAEALREALAQLPDSLREPVLMRYWEELDYAQMAKRTGLSQAALYQRVCRGLKALKGLLEGKSVISPEDEV